MADPLLQIRGLSKSYGGVRALDGLDLEVWLGEVHAIMGENGAGKSTLNKLLCGVVAPDAGEVLLDGVTLPFGSVAEAERAGVAIVHQESAAFPDLTAAENHQIMREPTRWGVLLDRRAMRERTEASLRSVGEAFELDRPMGGMSLAQRQMVAIARALDQRCRLLILDEPTASLSVREADALFEAVRRIRESGVGVLFVSHRLDEVFAIADRVTVLRDGRWVATAPVAEVDRDTLVRWMLSPAA
ncbi:MAG: hypothetical protein AMXMBFR81_27570 [Chthonomonas sp.]